MKCKNSKGSLNNPCSYCSGPVSPAFENLIVKSETSSHPEASMCWLCNIRPIDSVFHSNIEVPMRKTSLDFITRRTTLQTINIKIPVCIVCNLTKKRAEKIEKYFSLSGWIWFPLLFIGGIFVGGFVSKLVGRHYGWVFIDKGPGLFVFLVTWATVSLGSAMGLWGIISNYIKYFVYRRNQVPISYDKTKHPIVKSYIEKGWDC